MGKIKVAIVGVGNCASSLVQGIEFYKDAPQGEFIPGIMNVQLGPYHIGDIEIVAAFDVAESKVGKDLADAIFSEPNNTYKFSDVPQTGVTVQQGVALDGVGKSLSQMVETSDEDPADIVSVLREKEVDVLISYLPVGSEEATKWYVQQVLEAGVAFVNCMPVFIAREAEWEQKFKDAGVPIVGDDIKSQVGATITHRVLTHLFQQRGVKLERTYQLNFGGNTDFYNMLDRDRLASKKESKTNSVLSQMQHPISDDDIHVGPSDYVPWLEDRKWAYIRMEGETFGNVPLNIELKLEVWDSPNSAGVVIDAIRCCKIALDRGVSGALKGPSAYFMKSPPVQYTDEEAHQMVEGFVIGEGPWS